MVHIVRYIVVTDRKGLPQCRWFYVNEPKWPTTPMGHWTLPGKQFSNLEYLRYIFKRNHSGFFSEKEPLVVEVRSPPPSTATVKKLGLFSLIGISIVLTQVRINYIFGKKTSWFVSPLFCISGFLWGDQTDFQLLVTILFWRALSSASNHHCGAWWIG